MKNKNNLIWLDLEMTGLEPEKDTILEIATVITTAQLEFIAQGPALVIHQSDEILNSMNEWCKKYHAKSGLIAEVKNSRTTIQDAEHQTLTFVDTYCIKEEALLCGNSVWQDKAFIRLHMPKLYKFMHYKIIDVSSVKELVKNWYPKSPYVDFKKKDHHRALDDVYESMEELKNYRTHFFIPDIFTLPTSNE